jgi:hypothetical protein
MSWLFHNLGDYFWALASVTPGTRLFFLLHGWVARVTQQNIGINIS